MLCIIARSCVFAPFLLLPSPHLHPSSPARHRLGSPNPPAAARTPTSAAEMKRVVAGLQKTRETIALGCGLLPSIDRVLAPVDAFISFSSLFNV